MTNQSAGDRAPGTSGFIYFAAGVIAVGGLLFGYNATVIAGAILFVEKQFALSHVLEEGVIAASVVGALIGAGIAGPLADRYGRRRALFVTAAVFFLGALGSSLAPNVAFIAGGRVLAGVGVGLVSVLATLYLAEVAPGQVRGRLVAIYMTANLGGVLLGYLVELAFDASGSWRWMLGFPAFLAALFALGICCLPETPRWCLCNGRLEAARTALRRLRGSDDVDRELEGIKPSVGSGKGGWSELFGPALRPALLIGVCLGVLQRVTGIDIAFFYGPTIFEFAGIKSLRIDIVSGLGVGTAFVLGQIVSLVLIDRLGRRPLLLLGYAGMVCGLVPLGLAFAVGGESGLLGWMAVGGVILLAFAWAVGPSGVTFLLISEVYPQNVRGPAMSVATVAIWLSFLVMTSTFLTTVDIFGESTTFWGYSLICLIAMGAVYFLVPETKGKTLEEISAGLARRK